MTLTRAALFALAALGLGWYMPSTAADFADPFCWLTSLTPWPSCS